MGKITSKIIAEQAGVSVSTVSLVLNNKPGVGKKTRDKILRILMENDIHPKKILKARFLKMLFASAR